MASRSEVEQLSVSELKAFVSSKLINDVSEESLNELELHRVSGKAFLELDDNELLQLFPLIGERKAVKRLIGQCTQQPVSQELIPASQAHALVSQELIPASQDHALSQPPELRHQLCEWLSKRKETLRLIEKFADDFETFAARQNTIGTTFQRAGLVGFGSMVLGMVAAPFTGGASLAVATPVFLGGWLTGAGAGMVGLVNQQFAPSIEAIQKAIDEDLEKSKHLNQLFAMAGQRERVSESDIALNFREYQPIPDQIRALASKLRTEKEIMKGLLGDLE